MKISIGADPGENQRETNKGIKSRKGRKAARRGKAGARKKKRNPTG